MFCQSAQVRSTHPPLTTSASQAERPRARGQIATAVNDRQSGRSVGFQGADTPTKGFFRALLVQRRQTADDLLEMIHVVQPGVDRHIQEGCWSLRGVHAFQKPLLIGKGP